MLGVSKARAEVGTGDWFGVGKSTMNVYAIGSVDIVLYCRSMVGAAVPSRVEMHMQQLNGKAS